MYNTEYIRKYFTNVKPMNVSIIQITMNTCNHKINGISINFYSPIAIFQPPSEEKVSWCISSQPHNFRVITQGHGLIEQVKGNLDLTKFLNV